MKCVRPDPGPGLLLALAVLAAGCGRGSTGATPQLVETSGVTRVDGRLLFVSDDDPSGWYERDLGTDAGPLIPLSADRLTRRTLPAPIHADLESLGRLADGRLVFLSEDDVLLAAQEGVVARYDSACRERGNRGLEGVAVRPGANGGSVVAVVWEGGYPVGPWPSGPSGSRSPFVVVHEIPAGAVEVDASRERHLILAVPHPEGEEPAAQRFRVPDLVWHRQGDDWGFIALLSSENGDLPKRYAHHWLQRFDAEGAPVGDPLDLDALVPDPALRGRNWEGLGWFEEGARLVAVYENGPQDAVFYAFVVDLPEDWRAP